jgi:hypothetical protein
MPQAIFFNSMRCFQGDTRPLSKAFVTVVHGAISGRVRSSRVLRKNARHRAARLF